MRKHLPFGFDILLAICVLAVPPTGYADSPQVSVYRPTGRGWKVGAWPGGGRLCGRGWVRVGPGTSRGGLASGLTLD